MKPTPTNLTRVAAADGADELLLRTIIDQTDQLLTAGATNYSRYGLWFDTRYALWEGQNDEGIKASEDAFPWPGASDTRVRLADKIIRERTAIRKAAWYGKRLQARALQGANTGAAALANTLLKWQLYTKSVAMVHRETQLGWSYVDTYGSAVMGCFWKQRTQLEERIIDLEDLAAIAAEEQSTQALALLEMISDPLQADALVAGLSQTFPSMSTRELHGVVRRLRETGSATIRTPYVCANELDWLALRPGIDVFFDPSLSDLRDAPLISVRELLSEADLRERETSEGWDPAFIDQAAKHLGASTFDAVQDPLRLAPRGLSGRRNTSGEDASERVEIWRSFYRVHERGTTALYQTVYHRSVRDVAGLHVLHTYDHGQMPFIPWRCEVAERPIIESRGVPEICLTWQTEEKVERDFYTDRLSLEILPSLLVPPARVGRILLGPGAQIERRRSEEISYLQLPPTTQASELSRKLRDREICEYFGRAHPEADPAMVQLHRQALATDTLTEALPLIQQSWALIQQYASDEEITAVLGPIGQGLRLSREDIRGQFAFEFTYDVRVLDPDFLTTIVAAIKEIIPLDRLGVVDLSGLVAFLFQSIAPDVAERFLRPAQAAQMADVEDEMRQLGGIALGIEPPIKEASNPQLRLQVLQQVMQSPRYQQIVQADQTGTVQKLLENQLQKYQFQITQYQDNAQIGRTGVKPVMGGPGDGLPMTPATPIQP